MGTQYGYYGYVCVNYYDNYGNPYNYLSVQSFDSSDDRSIETRRVIGSRPVLKEYGGCWYRQEEPIYEDEEGPIYHHPSNLKSVETPIEEEVKKGNEVALKKIEEIQTLASERSSEEKERPKGLYLQAAERGRQKENFCFESESGKKVDSTKKSCLKEKKFHYPKTFDYPEILDKYLKLVNTDDFKQYLPYHNLGDEKKQSLYHFPPIDMLKSLKRIQCVYAKFETAEKKVYPHFLFPCYLSFSSSTQQKMPNKPFMQQNSLSNNEQRMVLELTLKPKGSPIHVLLKPLRGKESFVARNLGNSEEHATQTLKDIQFPNLENEAACLNFTAYQDFTIKAPLLDAQ